MALHPGSRATVLLALGGGSERRWRARASGVEGGSKRRCGATASGAVERQRAALECGGERCFPCPPKARGRQAAWALAALGGRGGLGVKREGRDGHHVPRLVTSVTGRASGRFGGAAARIPSGRAET